MSWTKSEHGLQYMIRLIGIRQWWEKLVHLSGSALLLWVSSDRNGIDLYGIIIYSAAAGFLLMGGYTINDAVDHPTDVAVGRQNLPKQGHSLFFALASLATGLVLMFTIAGEFLPRVITVTTILIGNDLSMGVQTFVVRNRPRRAMLLAVACAVMIVMLILSPCLIVPFDEALPVMVMLSVFSSVYLVKGLHSFSNLSEAMIK